MDKPIRVVYSEKQVAQSGCADSPSAHKPGLVAEALGKSQFPVTFIEPEPVTVADFERCHDPEYVHDILALKRDNGFGTRSQSVADSLPYTSGAMYTAARLATADQPVAALVSGFHHAGYAGYAELGMFCTFNGLMVAALKLIEVDQRYRVAIIDCDMHYGNGTEDIRQRLPVKYAGRIVHATFGKFFHTPADADAYLAGFDEVREMLTHLKHDVILYQSGADVHVNDPYGGVLTEEQMYERDVKMFTIARDLGIPLAWNLAGGYQVDPDGSIGTVLRLHLNTFRACQEVYGCAKKP